jgi:two-component system cell cycle sensor histidine kinase/response regulator CckA
MEQVIVNLPIDARDAMPDGGALSISTRNSTSAPASAPIVSVVPRNRVVLEVVHTGEGMDQQPPRPPAKAPASVWQPYTGSCGKVADT